MCIDAAISAAARQHGRAGQFRVKNRKRRLERMPLDRYGET